MNGLTARRRVPAQALPLGIVALLGGLYTIGALLGWTSDWAAAAAGAAAAGSLFYFHHLLPDTDRRRLTRDSYRWFGIAAVCWSIGSVTRAVTEIILSRTLGALSLADLFFVAAVVALAAGFVAPTRLPRQPQRWLRYAADTYVCVAALFVLGWDSIFGRLYHVSGESAFQFLLELIYPLLDIGLVCAVLPFVLGSTRRHRGAAVTAYLALLALTAGDVISTSVRLNSGTGGNLGDVARFAGLLLLGAAPWIGAAAEPTERRDIRGRLVGPGIAPAALAGAAAMFMAGHSIAGGRKIEPVVVLVAGTAVLVLLVRLMDILRENDRLRAEVRAGEVHFLALAESVDDLVLIVDDQGTVQYVSAGEHWNATHSPEDVLGRRLQEILHPEDVPVVEDAFAVFAEGSAEPVRTACRLRTADGTWLPTESTISRYAAATGDSDGRLLITTRDLSERAALQRQVTHLTFHDGLTGLPNRSYFEERTRQVLARRNPVCAVVFVDLDGFTAVNDSAGHAAGDQVLAQAARRMRAAVLADDTVARWGGDEFAVLVESAGEAQAVVDLAERLLRLLSSEPYRIGERGLALTASVGVAFAEYQDEEGFDEHETDAGTLIRNGDLAMARAKELGGGRVEIFATHMHANVVRRLELGSDLQRALAEEEFTVEFQPVVELATNRVTGVEALLRWSRDGVQMPPEEFIGVAEESGLMVPRGAWILNEACREVARWRNGSWDLGLSVNFTARQIAAPRFVEMIAAALAETGLPPHALTLEVREEVLVEHLQQDAQHLMRLAALRDLGVRLAIDDFGTGYASLAFLGQLPVDIIKIDPSFVSGLGRDDTLTLLTRTIVTLGSDLGLTVVAEGIERQEQLDLLREMGCPRGQGFLVAKPMSPALIDSTIRPVVVPLRAQAG
jgi:diguanylate cyclase (GGDEF)-like protein/PAS domain S-box-containing protein